MKDKQHIEDRVGVVSHPEITEEICPSKVSKDVDESCLESEQYTSEACNGPPAPVVELGEHMCTGRKVLL